jgi:hypothetical protein
MRYGKGKQTKIQCLIQGKGGLRSIKRAQHSRRTRSEV